MTNKIDNDKYIREHPKGASIGTCDIWDTDYNTDNSEPGFMTIFVFWQLIVTLDSIRNSCDVFEGFQERSIADGWILKFWKLWNIIVQIDF